MLYLTLHVITSANYDYIPVNYTLIFGPSLQSEQCRDIQTINDSLAEGLEILTVQLTTNSSVVELSTPQIMINIQDNDGMTLYISHFND